MSTALVLGNGNLLINIDEKLNLTDLYWPHVGQENHLGINKNESFIYIDGIFYSFKEKDWQFQIKYQEDSLASTSSIVNSNLGIEVFFEDTVLADRDIFIRLIRIVNKHDKVRNVTLFFKHNFQILENDVGDTAIWYPFVSILCHYKKDRYIGIGTTKSFYQYSCAGPLDNDRQGCVPRKDGELTFNPVSTGAAESAVSYKFEIQAKSEVSTDYFIVMGKNFSDLENEARYVKLKGTRHLYDSVKIYWKNWVRSKTDNFFDHKFPKIFYKYSQNERMIEIYKQSLLIIRTQFDNGGAIVASTDNSYLKGGGKDSYSYFWPRDGAMTVMALIEVGFGDLVKSFFEYLSKVITRDGYILHKYYPNIESGLASSWHPWVNKEGAVQLPIQEDETALVIYALWKHYERFADQEFLNKMWSKLVLPAANFLVNYRYGTSAKVLAFDEGVSYHSANFLDDHYLNSELPLPSYDLWEQNRGINLYTVATTYAGLEAAASLAEHAGHTNEQRRFKEVADKIKTGVENFMYDPSEKVFINRIFLDDKTNKCVIDKSLDTSMYALWKYNMFDVNDSRIERMMTQIESKLWLKNGIFGMARKENDNYLKVELEEQGNPWFISTLWFAQYYLAKNDKNRAKRYIEWAITHADSTGLLAEQADPNSGYGLSVKPLTWSHAEFIRTVNMLK